jgi:CHAT domain-containing protein
VLGVLPRSKPVALPSDKAIVLGDPRGDLASAREEAFAVAERLGIAAQVGAGVTSRALTDAEGAGLLHLAMHAELHDDGPILLFADRAVGMPDILAMSAAPRVVVLARCGGSAARDDAGWGSLAAAFLTAGASAVVASPWAVGDRATKRLVLQFYRELYRAGTMTDPTAALAAAQDKLQTEASRDWAGFTVIRGAP